MENYLYPFFWQHGKTMMFLRNIWKNFRMMEKMG